MYSDSKARQDNTRKEKEHIICLTNIDAKRSTIYSQSESKHIKRKGFKIDDAYKVINLSSRV